MERKIKKAAVSILAATMVLSIGATSVFAAGPGYGRNFVDADNEVICSYAGSACRFIDLDHDGICDNCGRSRISQNGYGRNFVDTDGDGICDNYGTMQGKGFCGGRNK